VVVLDPDLPVPLWKQLADILARHIESGEYTGKLPSAKTLAQEYEVSHKTSEHALQSLKEQGLVAAVKGLGYFVKR
jgi:DNA-binding GntR family transcriptional regulator